MLSMAFQEPFMQRILSFFNQTIKVVYPPAPEKIIDFVFSDFVRGQETLDSPSLEVKLDAETGRYSLSYPGQKDKSGISPHDLGQQLINSVSNALISNQENFGIIVNAGLVVKGEKAVLLPGSAGVGKSFLTAWLCSRSYDYLTDSLVCIRAVDNQAWGLKTPLSFKKSGRQFLDQLLGSQKHREQIADGTVTDLVPWRFFSDFGNVHPEVYPALFVFPEFRVGAELSLEALTPAQATLLLLASVANGRNLPGHGFPQTSNVSKKIPALRLVYGEFKQLTGVLDRIVGIILENNLTPTDFVAIATPFNRKRRIEELAAQSPNKKDSTPSPPIPDAIEKKPVTFPLQPATPKGNKKKLTIGMATYDDYDGVFFSVQSLRLYHSEIFDHIEILVVDNHPDGPCAADLKKLDQAITGYRYVPEQGINGTAVRDLIFREACGDFILCMDCHVLIVPGALQKLMEYLDAHPLSNDLLQGPLIYYDLAKISTHFQPVWRKGMYGIWETDERGRDSNSEPFEIPMQGLGLFCCRKDAWPGFNPRFRGFGGEEGYIHEKFRQNGGRVLCLPFLRWLHRFERPMGIPYRNVWEDRIHNYMVGFQELGLETQAVEEHFAEHLGKEQAGSICDSIKKEMSSPFFFFDAIYCISMDTASERWRGMLSRLKALRIAERVRVFKAIPTPENHHVGCTLSHRGVIALAHSQQLKNVLVFEDDAIFLDDTIENLAGCIEELKKVDWNIFYMGGHKWGQQFPLAAGCSFLQRPKGLTCAHALAYNASVFQRLLNDLPESIAEMTVWVKQNLAIDQYLRKIDKLYLAEPVLATQIELLPQESPMYRSCFMKKINF